MKTLDYSSPHFWDRKYSVGKFLWSIFFMLSVVSAHAQTTNTLGVAAVNSSSGYSTAPTATSLNNGTCAEAGNGSNTSVTFTMVAAHEQGNVGSTHTLNVTIKKSNNGGGNPTYSIAVQNSDGSTTYNTVNGSITDNNELIVPVTFTTAQSGTETTFRVVVSGTSVGTAGSARTAVVCGASLSFITANAPPIFAPLTQASNVEQGTPSAATQQRIDWTNGNGSARVVFVKVGHSGTAPAVDNTTYTANTVFGSGSQIGATGWYAVYNGGGATNTVVVTGLSGGTDYRVMVLEYNGGAGSEVYNLNSATENPFDFTTPGAAAPIPTTQATNIDVTDIQTTQVTFTWTNGNGGARKVFMLEGDSGSPSPDNNTDYAANTVFGSGDQIGASGWFTVYSGSGDPAPSVTVTGLDLGTSYRIMVVEYNEQGASITYLTDAATGNPANFTTLNYCVPQTQYEALQAMYNSLDGDNWTWTDPSKSWKDEFDNWRPLNNSSNWEGVSLDGSCNVTSLNLTSKGLTGNIPSEIEDLSSLILLFLNNNSLTGSIPSEIGNLSNLKFLNLSQNSLTGSIPSEIGNLSNLELLTFDVNSLTGSLPASLGNLVNLTSLVGSSNSLEGSIPDSFANLTSLISFYLNRNLLSGEIPAGIWNISTLERLSLYTNNLSGELPSTISNLTNLKELALSNNRFSGLLPSEIGNLSNLQVLQISQNAFRGPIPPSLTNLTNLTNLFLDYNGFHLWGSVSTPLEVFINGLNPNAKLTQTIYPLGIGSSILFPTKQTIFWDAIPFTAYGGNYIVYYGVNPLNLDQQQIVNGKSSEETLLENLLDGTDYYFQIATYTPASINNKNEILSDRSPMFEFRTPISIAERIALINFYNETDGDNWIDNSGWKMEPLEDDGFGAYGTEPNWAGVTIEKVNPFTVTELNLAQNNLSGGFPLNIWAFPYLNTLNLSGNSLIGSIPDDVKNLNQLTTLDISFNGLYAATNAADAFLSGLQPNWKQTQTIAPSDIVVTRNGNTANISWTPIPLAGQSLAGRYHITLVEFPAMIDFKYAVAEGHGSSSASISGLEEGKQYVVRIYTQTDAHAGNPNQLNSELSADIPFSMASPISVAEREALIALYQATAGANWDNRAYWRNPADSDFREAGSEGLWKGITLKKLSETLWCVAHIDLSNNNLTGNLPDVFAAFPCLESLNVAGNRLSGEVPKSLGAVATLKSLNISSNAFTTFELASFGAAMESLNVSYNGLGDGDDNRTLLAQLQPTYLATQTVAPSNLAGSSPSENQIDLSWSAIAYTGNGGYYEIEYGPVGGSKTKVQTNNKSAMARSLTGLQAETAYEISIRSFTPAHTQNRNAITSDAVSITVSTKGTLPARAELISPVNYSLNVTTNPSVSWKAAAKADSYEWQLASDYRFRAGDILAEGSGNATQTSLSNLMANTTYHVRVRGINSNGAGAWSIGHEFRTELTGTIGTTEGSSECLPNGQITFTWNAVAGANRYEFQLASSNTFAANSMVKETASLNGTSYSLDNLNAGTTYFWRVRGINDTNLQTGVWSATGQVSPQARISLNGSANLCAGGEVTLTAAAGTNYQWFNNGTAIAGATSQSYTANASGTYSVSLTTSQGCAYSSESVSIQVTALPTATVTASRTQFCTGESATLTAGVGESYQWYRNGEPIAGATSQSLTVTSSGNFSVEVGNAQGCKALSTAVNVTSFVIPQAYTISVAGSGALCAGESTTLSYNIPGSFPITWYRDGVQIAQGVAKSISVSEPGSYTASFSFVACTQTSAAVQITRVNLSKPSLKLGDYAQTQLNFGMPVAIQSSYAPIGAAYRWYRNGELLEGLNSAAIAATASGTYRVEFYTEGGCSQLSDPLTITYPQGKEPRSAQPRELNERDLRTIAEQIAAGWFSAWPNPTADRVTIGIHRDFLQDAPTLRVYNFIGRELGNYNLVLNGDYYEIEVDMSSQRFGLYYFHIEDGVNTFKKTVKKE